ncbi:hypothetical protein CQA40_05675 [Helicobacter sp. MIT 01-3238]|nr:hypothetical protein CQA40_05675 [Helicobacter sp. MIT 01-3238]
MKGIAMILHSNHIATIQKLAFSQDEIVKVFKSAKQIKQFNDFISNSIDSIEVATDKLIKLANCKNIPFAYLFLPEFPKIENALPDFRADSRDFSPNLQSCIGASKKKQEWFRNYLIRNGYDKFLNGKEIKSNADIIREIKILIDFDSAKKKSKGERFIHIKQALESNNIIVQQSGMSQNQTQKPISITECRGYAIYDEYAPLIFINSNDSSINGKIFTLLHELAHILLKHSGVSSYDFGANEEYQCNEIAGEILIPTNEFTKQWNKNISLENNIKNISTYFNDTASPLAIATKALLTKLTNNDEYQEFKETFLASITKIKKKSGGDYYSNITAANSKNFAKSVIIDTLNGYETYKDAMDLLDIKNIKSFNTLAEKLEVR